MTGEAVPLVGVAHGRERWGVAPGGTLVLREVGLLPQLDLRVAPEPEVLAAVAAAGPALPVEPNTTASGAGVTAAWLGPDEWLLLAPGAETGRLAGALRAALHGWHASVLEVSGQRTVLAVDGPGAAAVLAHGCALDLHPRAFGNRACAQTLLAGVPVLLLRAADGEGFRVAVRPSYAGHLAAWLDDAATEHWDVPGRHPART